MAKSNSLTHKVERKVVEKFVDSILKKMNQDRDKEISNLLEYAEKFEGNEVIKGLKEIAKDPNSRWMKFVNKLLDETNPHIAKMTILNLGYEAAFRGTNEIRKNREKYNCNIPWLILFDPTSACNMHCKGCWAGTYGHKYNLSFEDMDKIITEGKELGVYLYMLTGGEGRPDIVARLCMVVDWCIDHPEYTAKIKVIPKKDYPILMPCEF